MAVLAALLYQVLSAAMAEPPGRPGLEAARLGGVLLSLLLNLAYHWRALLLDRRSLERSLARSHAQYPVLVLAPEEESFSQSIAAALERQAPELPVAIHPVQSGAPDETLSVARAVILPAALLARPPEALRVWLQSFSGARLVVPTPAPDWLWISGADRSLNFLAERTAELVRRLAEGETSDAGRAAGAWQSGLFVPATHLVLQVLVLLLAFIIAVLVTLQD
jgi:hypothetical protein